jgi:molybdopterin molybdotransferase
VGDHDHIKAVVASDGEVGFWRVRVRPGKPLLFGRFNGIPVIGLPGNPSSAAVTYELFARPAIRTMCGAAAFRPQIIAVSDGAFNNRGNRRTFFRVNLAYRDGRFHATPAGAQDSAMLVPLATADGLLIAHENRTEIAPGEEAPVIVWKLPDEQILNTGEIFSN